MDADHSWAMHFMAEVQKAAEPTQLDSMDTSEAFLPQHGGPPVLPLTLHSVPETPIVEQTCSVPGSSRTAVPDAPAAIQCDSEQSEQVCMQERCDHRISQCLLPRTQAGPCASRSAR